MDDEIKAMRERLLQTFDLFERGMEMKTAELQTLHPDATSEQIDELLDQWLTESPTPGDLDYVSAFRRRPISSLCR